MELSACLRLRVRFCSNNTITIILQLFLNYWFPAVLKTMQYFVHFLPAHYAHSARKHNIVSTVTRICASIRRAVSPIRANSAKPNATVNAPSTWRCRASWRTVASAVAAPAFWQIVRRKSIETSSPCYWRGKQQSRGGGGGGKRIERTRHTFARYARSWLCCGARGDSEKPLVCATDTKQIHSGFDAKGHQSIVQS